MIDNLFGVLAFLHLAADAADFQPCYTAAVMLKLGNGLELPEWLQLKLVISARAKEWVLEAMTVMWLYGRIG